MLGEKMKKSFFMSLCFIVYIFVSSTISYAIGSSLKIGLNVCINDSVTLDALKVIPKSEEFQGNSGEYDIKIVDGEGNILYDAKVHLNFFIMTDPPREVNNTIFYEAIPFYGTNTSIRFYKNEKLLFDYDLKNLCNNDNYCNSNENYLSCPADCPLDKKDGLCIKEQDSVCDPDCPQKQDQDCTAAPAQVKTDNTTRILIAAIIAVILLFIILFIMIRIKTGSEK